MFEGLDWRSAARRSAVVIGIYLALFYALSTIFPKQFGLDSQAEVISLLGNAVVFFFVFTLVYAFIERSRNRRMAEMRKQQGKGGRASGSAHTVEGADGGALKGRPNPNTSRKKSRRRR
jgi:hypothetical protein